jgi:hypothetical protein
VQRGSVTCTDACSYCIQSGSCQPFGPQSVQADGTALEPETNAWAFGPARPVRPIVLGAGFGELFAESRSALGFLRRNCQGAIVERVASRSHTEEIHAEARQILL